MTKKQICMSCGFVGFPKAVVKGSILVEIFLWILFLLPGIIYSVWRSSSRHQVCPSCGNDKSLVPVDSPNGIRTLESQGKTKADIEAMGKLSEKEKKAQRKKTLIVAVLAIGALVIIPILLLR